MQPKFWIEIQKITRDIRLNYSLSFSTLLQAIFTFVIVTANIKLLTLIDEIFAVFIFFGIAIVSSIVSGVLFDYFNVERLQQISNIISTGILILALLVEPFRLVMTEILAFFTIFSLIATINIYISQTTTLNRGRFNILGLYSLAATFGPILLILFLTNFNAYLFIGILSGLTIVIYLWQKKYPLPAEIFQTIPKTVRKFKVKKEKLDDRLDLRVDDLKTITSHDIRDVVKVWFQTIYQSGVILLLIETFGFAAIFAFNITILSIYFDSAINIAIFVFLVLISVFIAGICIDYFGRKPLALVTSALMVFYTLFFDLGELSWYEPLFSYLFPITISLALMYLAAIGGDLSDNFRRGGIIGTIILLVILGVFVGMIVPELTGFDLDALDKTDIILVADIQSFIIIIGIFILMYSHETFEGDAIHWRRYLDRLLIITKSGTSLHFHQFNIPDINSTAVSKAKEDDGDLISSGLTGIQALLKEISHSMEEIQILDHADRKIIFSHGLYTTAILITAKVPTVLRTKLVQFHQEFEFINDSLLAHFTGEVSSFLEIPRLMIKYFDVKNR